MTPLAGTADTKLICFDCRRTPKSKIPKDTCPTCQGKLIEVTV